MTILSVIAVVFGVAGFAFGAKCYHELWRWARLCQRGRIVIAYNRRVQLNAPLTEWLEWTRMLKGDEKSKGRVIYRANKMSVAILYPEKTDTTTVTTVTPKGTAANGAGPTAEKVATK